MNSPLQRKEKYMLLVKYPISTHVLNDNTICLNKWVMESGLILVFVPAEERTDSRTELNISVAADIKTELIEVQCLNIACLFCLRPITRYQNDAVAFN